MATARRVTMWEARKVFANGGGVLVSERGHLPTLEVGPLSTVHTRETTTWEALTEQVEMWRGRYPNQRFYVLPIVPPASTWRFV